METSNLTEEEKKYLDKWVYNTEKGEMAQVEDLVKNCNNKFQFAKTHSNYLKDWEYAKKCMEDNLKNGKLSPGVSSNLYKTIIDATDKIIQKKLTMVRWMFEEKFKEPISNYLGLDGKTKKLFGIF